MERRLAAILAAEVVSYSRLMGADEAGTLSRLSALRKDRIEPLIEAHRGRIFKLTGDGILIEFASVVDAVGCAAAWQSEVVGDIRFRIGINLGEVMIEDGDLYGNGVNIASRLKGLADPGGICLSGGVHDEVRGKFELAFEDMGPQTVKNITDPVRAYRVVMPDATPAPSTPPSQGRSRKLGLAVLPLNNRSSGSVKDAFADGISEDIITALSRSYMLDVT